MPLMPSWLEMRRRRRRTFVVDLSVAVLVGGSQQRLGVGQRHAAAELGQRGSQFGRVDEAVAVDVEQFERRAHALLGVT